MQLVTQATRTLRLVAPFIDRTGLSFLADALAAATARGVSSRGPRAHSVHARGRRPGRTPRRRSHARATSRDSRVPAFVRRSVGAPQGARLRLRTAAYIGSANVTGAAIAGPNLELGILVRGSTVAVVERVLSPAVVGAAGTRRWRLLRLLGDARDLPRSNRVWPAPDRLGHKRPDRLERFPGTCCCPTTSHPPPCRTWTPRTSPTSSPSARS